MCTDNSLMIMRFRVYRESMKSVKKWKILDTYLRFKLTIHTKHREKEEAISKTSDRCKMTTLMIQEVHIEVMFLIVQKHNIIQK